MQQHYQKKDLQSFSRNTSFLKRRMGFLTLYKVEYSIWIEKILLFLEYAQLISQIMIVCCDDYTFKVGESDYYLDKKYFFDIITYFFKLINPSFLISFRESNETTASILCLVFAFSMLKLALLGYITYIAYSKKQEENPILVGLWRWIYKLQARVMCFFVTSFWVRSLLGLENEGFHLFGIGRPGCIVIYSLLTAVEYIFSFYLETQFCYRLSSKSFLASKGFQMQLVTLTQKIILQMIQVSFKTPSLACLWVLTSTNLLFCLVRSHFFYATLPLYKIQALMYQSDLINVVNSLGIACFFQTLLKAAHYKEFDSNFSIILAIALSLLSSKVFRGYLNQLILDLLTKNTKNYLPDLLLHKISFTVQLGKKLERPGEKNRKFDWTCLIAKAEYSRMEDIFDIQSGEIQNDMRLVYLDYLDNLSKRFPKNSLLKLHIAKICAKKSELYARAIKISADVVKNSWSQNYITFSFLLYKIQKAITQASTTSNTKLDLYTYVKSQLFFEELKNEISQQTQLTIDLCKNILQDVTEIGTIFNYAQEIHKHRVKIEKKMINFSSKIPEHFINPVKLWAEYQLVLNFSLHDYQKYNEVYTNKYSKCEKYFKAQDLTQENLYQETNAFLLLSGQKLDSGQILFCNRALEDLVGTKLDSILGSHVSSLFTSSLQVPFVDIFRQLFENAKTSILNQTTRAFLKHKNGYIIEVEFYLRIHPYITENLYLNMLIRPVPGKNESLFLRENGDIEGATKDIWKKFNLSTDSSSTINIKALSTELAKVNEAFNLIGEQPSISNHAVDSPRLSLAKVESTPAPMRKLGFSEHHNKSGYFLTKSRALELHSLYSSDPQKVRICPLKSSTGSTAARDFMYNCQVTILHYGYVSMKFLRLHEIFEQDNNDDYSPSPKRRRSLHSPRMLSVQQIDTNRRELSNQSFSSIADASENVDCEEVKHTDRLVTEWKGTLVTTEGNLLSPRTDRSQVHLLSPRVEEKPHLNLLLPISDTVLTEQEEEAPTPRKGKLKKLKSQHTGYPSSQTLTEVKLYKVFQTAISTKSYPRVMKALFYIFYAILLISFSSLIGHKIFLDATYKNLSIKKDMLVYAQLRSFYVMRLQTTCQGGSMQIAGTLTGDDYFYVKINQLMNLSHTWIEQLTNANQQIIQRIDYLESDIKAELFEKDVAVVGTYYNSSDTSSIKMTSFQAIDEVQISLQRLYNLSELFSATAYNLFKYVALNTVNDIVVKNFEITDLFLESVQRERDLLRLTMILYITILPILLAVILFMLIYTIWRQYTVERNHMLAFVKLHPQGVKTLFNTLTRFQKRLTDEEKFEERDALRLLISPVGSERDSRMSIYHKKQSNQLIKYSQIQKKYWGYTVQVILYAIILVIIIIWNYVSGQNSANAIYKRQNQLQFANQISVIISLSYIAVGELFATNNTNHVNHMLPYDALVYTLSQLDTIQGELDIFLEDDNTYDPEIKVLLMNSTCSNLWYSIFQEYCGYIQEKGLNTGLNSALSIFRFYARGKPGQYDSVDKTTLLQIINVGLENFDFLLWSSGVAAAEAQMIRQIINTKLEDDISHSKTQRTIILVIFVVSLVIVSVLMWKQILARVSNVNNDFKKVLQVFPADFVLSSFLLKNFLMESSQAIQNF